MVVEDQGTWTSVGRYRRRCRRRTVAGTDEVGEIGSRMSGTSASHRRDRLDEEGALSPMMNGVRDTVRRDISIGVANGMKSIPAVIVPTGISARPGAAIGRNTTVRHLLRHPVNVAIAAQCRTAPVITSPRRPIITSSSMTSAEVPMTTEAVVLAIGVAAIGSTADHLRHGWIVAVGLVGSIGDVARSGVAAAVWNAEVVGTSPMTRVVVTIGKWTTTGSLHRDLDPTGRGASEESGVVEDLGLHREVGPRRGQDPANGTETVLVDGLVRRRR